MSGYDGAEYNCNGHQYARVSSILGILDKGYGLAKWKDNIIKSKLSDDYYKLLSKGHEIDIDLLLDAALRHPNTVRDMRGAQGTNIHDALEALLDKDKDAYLSLAESMMILLQQHNMKEEQMLYAMCDRMLPADVKETTLEAMKKTTL